MAFNPRISYILQFDMTITIESKLDNIEKELREIKKRLYRPDSKKKFFKAAGSWSNVDTEELKKNIYESRSVVRKEKVEF